jgi:hypothetical protein
MPNLVPTSALPRLHAVQALGERALGRVLSFGLLRWPAVPYGPDPAQRLYLWELHDLAPRDGWPAVILVAPPDAVHAFAALGPRLAQQGVLAAALQYRVDHATDDLASALAFLESQQVDRDRLALWGEGVGAAMAVDVARTHGVRAVVALGAEVAAPEGTALRTATRADRATRRGAVAWLTRALDPAPRGSKWKIRRSKKKR